MNIHVPQSIQTRYELEHLTIVTKQILSPANSSPLIAISQDSLVAGYLLTQPNVKISERNLFNIMAFSKRFTPDLLPKPIDVIDGENYYSGHQMFSLILPELSYDKEGAIIRNGILTKGVLGDKALSSKNDSLVHNIYNMFGSKTCHQFLDNAQRMLTQWMMGHAFSIGLGDMMPTNALTSVTEFLINKYLEKANDLVESAHQGVFEPNLTMKYRAQSFEDNMQGIFSQLANMFEKASDRFLDANRNQLYTAVKSGSKGVSSNITQIMCSLGQRTLWGYRVPKSFTSRSLPHYHKHDIGAAAGGFVRNSYIKGITPAEFFFDAMGGRTGMIDTAINTANSGYIQRRLIKAMEDLKVCYNGNVRNAANNIVQFVYGDDGFDTMRLEKQKLNIIADDNITFDKNYKIDIDDLKQLLVYMTDDAVKRFKADKDHAKKVQQEYLQLRRWREELRENYMADMDVMDTTIFSPVNYYRMIPAAVYKFRGDDAERSDLTPLDIIEKTDELLDYITNFYRDKEHALLYVKILTKSMLSSKQALFVHKINSTILEYLIHNVKNKILNSFMKPGEMVGTLAAQSIGEPSTQMTLNSVDWEEPIIVMVDGVTKSVKFGEFVDEEIDTGDGEEEYHKNETTLKWTKHKNYKVMAVDEDGIVRWRQIEAVTKHLPVNEDGSNTLIKVTTRSGRTATATKAKSFLTRVDNKIIPTKGADLRIGDRLPVSYHFPMNDIDELNEISIEEYFPKSQFIWGSEMVKALEFSKTKRRWFKEHNGVEFTVPYNRSDSCLEAFKAKTQKYVPGFVYNKFCTGPCNSYGIPEKFDLDELFGFFIGAYLAEGLATNTYVAIANNDEAFQNKIIEFCEKYNFGYHTTEQKKELGVSKDIRIHSTMLAAYMKVICRTGSEFKKVPDFAFVANIEFIKGILNGYYSGDGCVSKKNTIDATSVSEELVDGIMNMLARFDIFSIKRVPIKITKNNRGSKNIKQHYTLHITCANVLKFARSIPLVILKKQERLDVLCHKYKSMYDIGRYDIIPSVKIGKLNGDYHRDKLKQIIECTTDEKEIELLQKAIDQHAYFDEIVSIEEIEPTHKYVYDFTVEEDRTFLNRNFMMLEDTFHLAGVAGKSVVTTSGVARLTEIINLAKTIKTPSMTIRLKDEYKYSEEKAEQLKESLEYTSIKDIISESQILYEHDDLNVSHSEDIEFIRTYFEFSNLMGLEDMTSTYSKWVLRLIFDRESMLNRNIYMQDIQDAIMNTCDSQGEIQAIFSDDNSGNLVMRISIHHEEGESYLDFLKELEQCIMKITLRGIQGIEKVGRAEANHVIYHDDGSYEVKKEWVVSTIGTNLKEVFGHDIVDPYYTNTNDFYEIEEIFGIEGVRYALMKDLNDMVGVGSSYNVNYRHIELLVDTMTYRGIMMPIGRHGINRSADNGPLTKASFEEMTEIFVKAGTYAEKDNMKSVSGNIIMGQYAPIGTNAFDVYLDEDMIAEHAPDIEDDDDNEIDEYELEQEIDDMYNDEKTIEEDVTDDMFDFGLDYDFNNQYQLGTSKLAPPVLNVDGKIEKIETVEVENDDDESIDLSSDEEEDEEVEIDVSETDEAENEEEIDVTDDEEEVELHEDAERLEGDTNDEDDAESIDVSDDEKMGDDQEVKAKNIYEEDIEAEEEEDEEEIDVSDED